MLKIATALLAGAILATPVMARAQTAADPAKPTRAEAVKVPRASAAPSNRALNDTERVIDDEQKRIDHMMAICTGC